ncbi:MAG: hypothetical protein EOP67_10925 [Sphingomonas sp.]|nr:MAG: hypothetical protein EOP67_10925 [Sphingomonas sp.]
MLYGSGLRTDQTLADGSTVPNGGKLSPYAQVNLAANHHFSGPGIDIRFDVINVADHKYEIRDGGGVGVGAPQYGPRDHGRHRTVKQERHRRDDLMLFDRVEVMRTHQDPAQQWPCGQQHDRQDQ